MDPFTVNKQSRQDEIFRFHRVVIIFIVETER